MTYSSLIDLYPLGTLMYHMKYNGDFTDEVSGNTYLKGGHYFWNQSEWSSEGEDKAIRIAGSGMDAYQGMQSVEQDTPGQASAICNGKTMENPYRGI